MLAGTSVTFPEVLIPVAMRGIIEIALRRPQASLASEFHRHAARTLRQSLLITGQVHSVHCPIHCQ